MPEPPKREADTARVIRARGLARDRAVPQIAHEIYERCLPLFGTSRIKAYRLANGVALADVIEQVRALYELDGKIQPKLGETLLSAYEGGHKRPGPIYLHYLCAVYRAEPADLGYQGPCICGRGHGRSAPRGPAGGIYAAGPDDHGMGGGPLNKGGGANAGHPAVIVSVTEETKRISDRDRYRASGPGGGEEEDYVLRRTLLQFAAGAGVALDGQILAAAETMRRQMDDTLMRATVSPAMLDRWEETIAGYGRDYMRVPPLRMLCDVLLDFSEVRRLCEQHQPVESQERLCRFGAKLAGLAGIILCDLGDQRLARSYFHTARTAADETGDRDLSAWVITREALVPMYYGDPREALHLARKAQELAGRGQSAGGAMAPVLEARALGQLAGRGRDDVATSARRALARGRAVFGRLSPLETGDAVFGFTDRQLMFYEGDVYLGLGDTKRADESFSQALRLYSPGERLDRTLVLLERANCRLKAGEPDESLRAAQSAIGELPADHRPDIVMHKARQLVTAAVGRYGELGSARDFRDSMAVAVPAG